MGPYNVVSYLGSDFNPDTDTLSMHVSGQASSSNIKFYRDVSVTGNTMFITVGMRADGTVGRPAIQLPRKETIAAEVPAEVNTIIILDNHGNYLEKVELEDEADGT